MSASTYPDASPTSRTRPAVRADVRCRSGPAPRTGPSGSAPAEVPRRGRRTRRGSRRSRCAGGPSSATPTSPSATGVTYASASRPQCTSTTSVHGVEAEVAPGAVPPRSAGRRADGGGLQAGEPPDGRVQPVAAEQPPGPHAARGDRDGVLRRAPSTRPVDARDAELVGARGQRGVQRGAADPEPVPVGNRCVTRRVASRYRIPVSGWPSGRTPSRSSASTAPGMRPSPHALSTGPDRGSTTTTSYPARVASIAAASPTGPPPTTSTSVSRVAGDAPAGRRGARRVLGAAHGRPVTGADRRPACRARAPRSGSGSRAAGPR